MQAPRTAAERQLENLTRIILSAFLSAFESFLYYVKRAAAPGAGKRWFKKQTEGRAIIAAFERLRNREVHHQPLNTLIGARYRITQVSARPEPSLEDVSHVHFGLLHEGIGFAIDQLQVTKQFSKRHDLVNLVTEKSVLDATHDCLHALSSLVYDGIALDEHLSPYIASVFGQRAYDHIAGEVGLAGKPDSDVIDYAIAKGCMTITNDAGLVQQYKSDPRRRTKHGMGFFNGLLYVRAETNEKRKRHIAKAPKEIAWQETRRHDDLIVISRDGETEHFRLCHAECAAALDKEEGRLSSSIRDTQRIHPARAQQLPTQHATHTHPIKA